MCDELISCSAQHPLGCGAGLCDLVRLHTFLAAFPLPASFVVCIRVCLFRYKKLRTKGARHAMKVFVRDAACRVVEEVGSTVRMAHRALVVPGCRRPPLFADLHFTPATSQGACAGREVG